MTGTASASAGAPIIDPVLVGLKYTERWSTCSAPGLPIVSRYGAWQKPPLDEVEQLAGLAEHAELAIAR